MIRSFVAIDVETTGLRPEANQIIEVGALRVRDGEVTDTLSLLIRPNESLPEKIVELTGITDEMLENQKSFSEQSKIIYDFIGQDPLLGHNIQFDYGFLKYHLANSGYTMDNKIVDTLAIAKRLHPGLPSRSLASMCCAYGLVNKAAHRAYEDARVTMQLYFAMCESIEGLTEEKKREWERFTDPVSCYIKLKKLEPITPKQKNYLNDLLKYHKINKALDIDNMTKSEASRTIDRIILEYGRMR